VKGRDEVDPVDWWSSTFSGGNPDYPPVMGTDKTDHCDAEM
jgi:hypothetical protein